MATFWLGNRLYPSKAAAIAEFRAILNRHPLATPLTASDAALVESLIRDGYHPEASEKIGVGVSGFDVRRNEYGTRGFWIRRTDGTAVDFSYLVAINGIPRVAHGVRAALREEVRSQIFDFRDAHTDAIAAGCAVCELCGDVIRLENFHVDHAQPTFAELAERFAAAVGGWGAIEIECIGASGRSLVDRDYAQVWKIFHWHTAQLRLTHAKCNLERLRSGR